MGPGARTRFRRWTAFLAIAWALASLIVGVQAKLEARSYPFLPFSFSSAAGIHVINEVGPISAGAGLEPRDRLVSIDGMLVQEWMRHGLRTLQLSDEVTAQKSRKTHASRRSGLSSHTPSPITR